MIVETNVSVKPIIGSFMEGDVFQFEGNWYMVVCIDDGSGTLRNDQDDFIMANAYKPCNSSDEITIQDGVISAVRLTDGEVYYFKDSWKVQEYGKAKVSITISK